MIRAFLAYLAISLVMTWPLALGLSRDIPGDLGDSLLNMWILGWGAEHVPRLLTGQTTVAEYWNANIFHPEPLALSLSEHLSGQVIQILPVYWLTGNLILSYNLLFLTSFALSGLGMFLLTRELLIGERAGSGGKGSGPAGDPFDSQVLAQGKLMAGDLRLVLAAFIAGLIYAFLPFRIAQVAHIQSLSSQWMPLALFGFVRFIRSGRARALAGGSAALVMQNWSCGYYLIFFAPFVPLFVVHQLWTAGRLRDRRVWLAFGAAAVAVVAATSPFLALYLEGQRVHGLERTVGEVIRFSADVYSYLTAPEALRVWGEVMQAYPKPEGELFFGVVPWGLALGGLLASLVAGRASRSHGRDARRPVVYVLLAIIAVQTVGFIAILFTGGFITSFGGIPLRATNPTRILVGISLAVTLLLAVSRPTRQRAGALLRSPAGIAVVFMLLAMWLSLGPMPQSRGRALDGLGVYDVLYEHVPGFEGLRVPARYAMLAGLFLSIAAGAGAAALVRHGRRPVLLAALLTAALLIDTAFVPMPINLTWSDSRVPPPARVEPADDAPPVYHQLARMPDDTVVAEFPFGDPAWELRYVYYSSVHWKRLVNGYSGAFPQGYKVRVALLQRLVKDPAAAWRALRDAGTTHVVVHEHAFGAGEADVVKAWLEEHFAVEIARFETDRLYAMPEAFR